MKNVGMKSLALYGLLATSAIFGGVAVKQTNELEQKKTELNFYKEAYKNDPLVNYAISKYQLHQIQNNLKTINGINTELQNEIKSMQKDLK